MSALLDEIKSPEDLRKLSSEQINDLCEEIRQEIIAVTSRNGGHLASSLGAVELTVAAHLAFHLPEDKIIWDVGHQSYAHKILTGRKDRFETLRKEGGVSGFPKREESEYDAFNTGHSSTALSAALGMVRAMRLRGDTHQVLAVIGDGSFGGGMNWEALNDAGHAHIPMVVLLNDNEMSISRNVGAFSAYLTRLRSAHGYVRVKRWVIRLLTRSSRLFRGLDRAKNLLKYLLTDGILFEEMGWTYLGPVDGHNVQELRMLMERAQSMERPVLIHAITRKGTGMMQAQRDPTRYHAVNPWYVEGPEEGKKGVSMAPVAGAALTDAAKEDKTICAITAAMTDGVGLRGFSQAYPERFFDTGITEQHAVTMAAGMAAGGVKPVVCIYATFLQRAFDSLLHDVCLQKLPVKLLVSHCGCVGEDGETHQGIYAYSMLLPMPNLAVFAPCTPAQLPSLLRRVLAWDGPAALCYPKEMDDCDKAFSSVEEEVWPLLRRVENADTVLVCVGRMNRIALDAVQLCETSADVVAADQLMPLPESGLTRIMHYSRIFVLEDGVRDSGVGVHIHAELNRRGYEGRIVCLGHSGKPIPQATYRRQLEKSGLDAASIAKEVDRV